MASLIVHVAMAALPHIAAWYVDAILDHCDSLATFPKRAAHRDDLSPGLRILGFLRRVSIAFVVEEHTATIHGIFKGGQNLEIAIEE